MEHEDPEAALTRAVEAHDFFTWLKVEWNEGNGTTYDPKKGEKPSNSLFPGWKPVDVRDIVSA